MFSGIQPSGNLHIGNYIGAVKRWVEGQNDGLNIFCIVDMHAITVIQDPKLLSEKTLELAAILLAAGIDPNKSILFVQSRNPDHANLGWIINCNTSMGQLSRMTQFKDKSEGRESVSVGLFDYPALMAADILLYNTTQVPVGEDQKQHVELTRDVAEHFNARYGETFVLPTATIAKSGARIMSLSDPARKMSKSDPDDGSRVNLMDSEDVVLKKIKSAVTDSESRVAFDSNRPGISNLVTIYSQFSGMSFDDIESQFAGKNYGEFKEALAHEINQGLKPFQNKFNELRESSSLREILEKGAQRAREISTPKLEEVYDKVGFVK